MRILRWLYPHRASNATPFFVAVSPRTFLRHAAPGHPRLPLLRGPLLLQPTVPNTPPGPAADSPIRTATAGPRRPLCRPQPTPTVGLVEPQAAHRQRQAPALAHGAFRQSRTAAPATRCRRKASQEEARSIFPPEHHQSAVGTAAAQG